MSIYWLSIFLHAWLYPPTFPTHFLSFSPILIHHLNPCDELAFESFNVSNYHFHSFSIIYFINLHDTGFLMDFLWISIIFHRISSGFPHLEPFSSSLSSPSSAEVHPTGKGAKCDPLPKEEVAGEKLDGIIAAKFGTGEFSAEKFQIYGM